MGDIVNGTYEKLSTESAVAAASNVANVNLINVGDTLNIPVKCYCGDPSVNSSYGLFTTYVVHSGDQLSALASNFSVDADLITKYNPSISTLQADQIIFIPARGMTLISSPIFVFGVDSWELHTWSTCDCLADIPKVGLHCRTVVDAFLSDLLRRQSNL